MTSILAVMGGSASAAPNGTEQIVADAVAAAPAVNAVAQPDLVARVEPRSKKASIELVQGATSAETPAERAVHPAGSEPLVLVLLT